MENEKKVIGKCCPKYKRGFAKDWLRCYNCGGQLINVYGRPNSKDLLDPVKPGDLVGKEIGGGDKPPLLFWFKFG